MNFMCAVSVYISMWIHAHTKLSVMPCVCVCVCMCVCVMCLQTSMVCVHEDGSVRVLTIKALFTQNTNAMFV